MKTFMDENFLLENKKGAELYQQVKDLPIFDYHCHLDPKEIYENRSFYNLTELWLECDHYKWRVMRNAGVSEEFVTGKADPYEKFLTFARSLPLFPGNPVYHWAHLELKKYFGITEPLSEKTAPAIWEQTKKIMADGSFCARNLIRQSNIDTIFTTDDPTSDLKYHALLAQEKTKNSDVTFTVSPSFRPDRFVNIEKPDFPKAIAELEKACDNQKIENYDSLVKALNNRLDFFVDKGCAIADISFTDFPKIMTSDENMTSEKLTTICDKAIKIALNSDKSDIIHGELSNLNMTFKYCMIKDLALMFAQKNMTMQIHTGVLRNQNTTRFAQCGADCGIDSVGNSINIEAAGLLFDDIEKTAASRAPDCASSSKLDCGGLPRIILYTLNPNSYYPIATMIGDFAGKVPGRMQMGAAWWFMDHRDGIKEQLKIFANTSGLGVFNGMLTDSRSFVSYARHDYFRRILCSVIGEWIENGEYPDDENAVQLVKNISFYNAKNNFSR